MKRWFFRTWRRLTRRPAPRPAARLGLERLEGREVPAGVAYAVGSSFNMVPGTTTVPRVIAYNEDGSVRFDIQPYNPLFRGGVSVAVGDVTGDGFRDLVVAPGMSGGPHVKVFDGQTGQEATGFMAYTPGFTGGVSVAVGDVNGDGTADILTGAGPGGGPHVRAFSGAGGQELFGAMAYNPAYTGGVSVGAGDVNGDGRADIVTGTLAGGGPHAKIFSGANGQLLNEFMAFDPAFFGGIWVTAGDVNGDGQADIITGGGVSGPPHVRIFNGQTGALVNEFFAYPGTNTGGVRVGVADVNRDGRLDILAGDGPGFSSSLRVFDGSSLQSLTILDPLADSDTNGIFVG